MQLVTFFNVLLVALVLLVNTRPGSAHVKPEDLLDCVIREMREYVNRTMEVNGRVLRCEGPVRIKTCFGRCISYEVMQCPLPNTGSRHNDGSSVYYNKIMVNRTLVIVSVIMQSLIYEKEQ